MSLSVIFDEFHSESWSISRQRAAEINPDEPAASSYASAAAILSQGDFAVERNAHGPITPELLEKGAVFVLLHPCDPQWEPTTSEHSPKLCIQEIEAIHRYVRNGGGLIIVSEYEHSKYGDNLNLLIAEFGLRIENNTVTDAAHCHHDNATWIFGSPEDNPLAHQVHQACFYRAGSCVATAPATLAWTASGEAHPANAGLIALAEYGEGRVALVTDSSLFGDRHFHEFDHRQLWLNLFYWCSLTAFRRSPPNTPASKSALHPAWVMLKSEVNRFRMLQNPDGSLPEERHFEGRLFVVETTARLWELSSLFPHQAAYFTQVERDLTQWEASQFGHPDFSASLAEYNPQQHRINGLEHLVLFPMYTPNASKEIRFEALIVRTPWPEWLATLERDMYRNTKFAPGHLVDYTDGYKSECAVLFPETVAVSKRATNNFATIFCDREAARLQKTALRAAGLVSLTLHPQLECFFASLPLIENTVALWDLIHDKSHSMGELPFDPFMIRQRAPFWMYGIEELRVDLNSFCEATRLAREGFPFAHYVTYAVLFDRIFRFAITGPRVRNYDALGGQLLFAYLHQHDVLVWKDNRLSVQWERLLEGVKGLREELIQLYKLGADCSKMTFWIAAHDLVARYVPPNLASVWRKDRRAITDECDPKKWLSLIQEDEFPLGSFHLNLRSKLS